jgi:hypothetical protein
MKRSFLTSLASSLVLSVAVSVAVGMAACGGSGPGGDTTASGTDADGGAASTDNGGGSSDDPVASLQKMTDDLSASVDAVISPITNAGPVIDGIASLKTDIKPPKGTKFDWKKLLVEVQKVVNGADADIASLKLDADSTQKITDRIGKLKDLVTAVKNVDQSVKDLGQKITDTLPKLLATAPKALAKAELTLKNPFAKDADKKDAQATKDKINGIVDGFKAKAAKWQTDLASLATTAKDIPKKLAALK